MKKNHKKYFPVIFLLATICITGCGQQSIPPVETQAATTVLSETAITPTLIPAQPTVVESNPTISGPSYTSVSGVFQINLPQGWNCSESGSFQVNCESPSADALLQARITSTGYELTDESLAAFAHAELVHRYGEVKEYTEIERAETPARVINRATWRRDGEYWEGVDAFTRKGRGVFHLTFANLQTQSENYADMYSTISESVKVYPEKLTREALYPFRRTVSARDAFFEIEVPTSWGSYLDINSVKKTIVEGYMSPDQRASVQIAVYRQSISLDKDAKGFNTREIMFELYGYDLKNSDDRALPDGRERLTWYAAGKDINGITDFDAYRNALYLLTITWEPSTASIYLPVLEEIQLSFNRD